MKGASKVQCVQFPKGRHGSLAGATVDGGVRAVVRRCVCAGGVAGVCELRRQVLATRFVVVVFVATHNPQSGTNGTDTISKAPETNANQFALRYVEHVYVSECGRAEGDVKHTCMCTS